MHKERDNLDSLTTDNIPTEGGTETSQLRGELKTRNHTRLYDILGVA